MAQVAGELEIRMFAELARLRADMEKATGIVARGSKNIEDAASIATKALGFLGLGISAVGFVNLIKGSIDSMDKLNDLSKSTGITVEQLAGLKVLAKQSGTDLDGLAKGINKMSVEMGKSPEAFRALGITAKDNIERIKQLSDLFNSLTDINQRNALSNKIFGKSWAEMAPVLSEGGKKIGEIVELGSKLSGTTKEMVQQADAFNDKWVLLTGTGGLLTRLVGPMLPLLNMLADNMLDAGKKAEGLDSSFNILKGTLQLVVLTGAGVEYMFTGLGNTIGAVAAITASVAVGNFKEAAAIYKAMGEEQDRATARLNAFRDRVLGAGLTGKAAPGAPPVDPAVAAAAAKKAAAFIKAEADNYAARIAVIKIGGEAYAEQIQLANKLAELAMKEGGINNQRTREALLEQQQTNTADQIFDLMQRQDKIRKLAQEGGQTPAKIKDAATATQEIEKLNAKLLASEAITQAQIRAERTVTAQQQADQYNAFIASHEQIGATLADSLRDATDRENESYQIRLTNLEAYLSAAQGQVADDAMLREALKIEHEQRLLEIERNKNQAVRSMQIGTWQLGAELLQSFAGKSKAAAIAVIAINKGLAIAQAIQSTAVAIMRAYADLGPIAGTAAAAGITALGAVQIGLIAATGLMQAASVGSGGASLGSPANPVNTTGGLGSGPSRESMSDETQGSQVVLNMTVNGHILDTQQFTDTVMIPALRDAIDNRDVTVIGPNSRQAANLAPA